MTNYLMKVAIVQPNDNYNYGYVKLYRIGPSKSFFNFFAPAKIWREWCQGQFISLRFIVLLQHQVKVDPIFKPGVKKLIALKALKSFLMPVFVFVSVSRTKFNYNNSTAFWWAKVWVQYWYNAGLTSINSIGNVDFSHKSCF